MSLPTHILPSSTGTFQPTSREGIEALCDALRTELKLTKLMHVLDQRAFARREQERLSPGASRRPPGREAGVLSKGGKLPPPKAFTKGVIEGRDSPRARSDEDSTGTKPAGTEKTALLETCESLENQLATSQLLCEQQQAQITTMQATITKQAEVCPLPLRSP
jgi:hypothetical protein